MADSETSPFTEDNWRSFLEDEANHIENNVAEAGDFLSFVRQVGDSNMVGLMEGAATVARDKLAAMKARRDLLVLDGQDARTAEAEVRLAGAEYKMLGGDPGSVPADRLSAWVDGYGYKAVAVDSVTWDSDRGHFTADP